jgi:hypothetical protein
MRKIHLIAKFVGLSLLCFVALANPALANSAQEECEVANRFAHMGMWDDALMFYAKSLAINPYYGPALSGQAYCMHHRYGGGERATRHHQKSPHHDAQRSPHHEAVREARHKESASHVARHENTSERSEASLKPDNSEKADTSDRRDNQTKVETAEIGGRSETHRTEPRPTSELKLSPGETVAPNKEEQTTPAAQSNGTISPIPSAIDPTINDPLLNPAKAPNADATSQPSAPAQSNANAAQSMPIWLILLACVGFVGVVVGAVFWLSPAQNAKRSQQKLKTIDRDPD